MVMVVVAVVVEENRVVDRVVKVVVFVVMVKDGW